MTGPFDRLTENLGSRYRIERELGRGGMAVVYLAADLRHGRQVAVKAVRPEMAAAIGNERFLQEIRIAAGLTHPRIVSVFDSGEVDGTLYYVMPFIDAPTLRQRLDQPPRVSVAEALGIARDVARALIYAHAHGIVHRDIKPENIMLPAGEAVVTDFGVARPAQSGAENRLTEVGLVIGTPAYMSPEQADGEASDKSDVYALGCVLYEMLSGAVPYPGRTAIAVFAQHLTAPIPSPLATRPEIPAWVGRLVERAMAKEPGDRPTAAEFVTAIEAGPATREPERVPARPTGPSIAILPFKDLSGEGNLGWLAGGIAEELRTALSGVAGLRVVSPSSAALMRAADSGTGDPAGMSGADSVLEGSVRAAGDQLRVTVQLLSGSDRAAQWSHRFDGQTGNVFDIEDRIVRAVLDVLESRLTPAYAPVPSVAPPTSSAEAHRLYLLGRQALGRRTDSGFHEAIDLFGRAAAADPAFGLPHVGAAEAQLLSGIYGLHSPASVIPAARASADQALASRPGLSEALTVRATTLCLFEWQWGEAERDFLAALGRAAVSPATRQSYAMYLLAPLGRFAEARAQLEMALEQDPFAPTLPASLGQVALFERRFESALGFQRRALQLDQDFAPAHLFAGQALTEAGRLPEALQAFERFERTSGRTAEVVAALALAVGRGGDRKAAQGLAAELMAMGDHGYLSPVLMAIAWLGAGDRERALAALEEGFRLRALDLVWIGVRPAFLELAAEPRFRGLLRELGLGRAQA